LVQQWAEKSDCPTVSWLDEKKGQRSVVSMVDLLDEKMAELKVYLMGNDSVSLWGNEWEYSLVIYWAALKEERLAAFAVDGLEYN
jgi:hypothetical protein